MYIIESADGNIIKVEDGNSHFYISPDMIKGGFKTGDVIVKKSENTYETDSEATERRRKEIISLHKNLFG